jgi:hypothetical protein
MLSRTFTAFTTTITHATVRSRSSAALSNKPARTPTSHNVTPSAASTAIFTRGPTLRMSSMSPSAPTAAAPSRITASCARALATSKDASNKPPATASPPR